MLNKINISPEKQRLIIYVILILTTLTVFWQVNNYDFVNSDDPVYVTANSHIQSGITLNGFKWAFGSVYAEFWHPLTWLSLMLDNQFYGMNPGGYHLTNLILHILSVLLLFWLFNRMTGAIWKSAFVAAFFALHPLHVESVAWIAERKDVLSAFFWMITLCLYVYYTEKPVIRRYLLVLFSFLCALMSKPMVVTLPVIMILLDYWPLKRFDSRKGNLILWQLKEKLPLFVLSAVFSLVTVYAQYKPSFKQLPLNFRVYNATISLMAYLEKIFLPNESSVLFSFSGQPSVGEVLLSVLCIITISTVVIVMIKRLPFLFVGWLFYIITILPVTGIIQIGPFGPFLLGDRYTYLPSIGISIGIAWGIPALFSREDMRKKILFPAAITILVVLAVLTWRQCGYWKNSFELCNKAMQANDNNKSEHAIAHNCLGKAYFEIGQYRQAIDDFSEAVRLRPDIAEFYYLRGISYGKLGIYSLSMDDFNKAIRLKPRVSELYYNRGNIYVNLGLYQRSIEDYNRAIFLKPDYADAYLSKGIAYFKQGDNKRGCFDAQKACGFGQCQSLEWAKSEGYCR